MTYFEQMTDQDKIYLKNRTGKKPIVKISEEEYARRLLEGN